MASFSYSCSLRAQFGVDTMKNAVHGSSSLEKAEKVIKEFLPEVEILPDGTVRGLNFQFVCAFSQAHHLAILLKSEGVFFFSFL